MKNKRFYFAIRHELLSKDNERSCVLSICSDFFYQAREYEAEVSEKEQATYIEIENIGSKKNPKLCFKSKSSISDWFQWLGRKRENGTALFFIVPDHYQQSDIDRLLTKYKNTTYILISQPLIASFKCFVRHDNDFSPISAFDEVAINPILGSQVHYHTLGTHTYQKSWPRKLLALLSAEGAWPDTQKNILPAKPLLNLDQQLSRMRAITTSLLLLLSLMIVGIWWFDRDNDVLQQYTVIPQLKVLKNAGLVLSVNGQEISDQQQMQCVVIQAMLTNKSEIDGVCGLKTYQQVDTYLKKTDPQHQSFVSIISDRQTRVIKAWESLQTDSVKAWKNLGFTLFAEGLDTAHHIEKKHLPYVMAQLLINENKNISNSQVLIYNYALNNKLTDRSGWKSIPNWDELNALGLGATHRYKNKVKPLKTQEKYLCRIVQSILGAEDEEMNQHKDAACGPKTEKKINQYLIDNSLQIQPTESLITKQLAIISQIYRPQAIETSRWIERPTLNSLKRMGISIKGTNNNDALLCKIVQNLIGLESSTDICNDKTEAKMKQFINNPSIDFIGFLKTNYTEQLVVLDAVPQLNKLQPLDIKVYRGKQELTTQAQINCFAVQAILTQKIDANECLLHIDKLDKTSVNTDQPPLQAKIDSAFNRILQDWERQRKNIRKNLASSLLWTAVPHKDDLDVLGLTLSDQAKQTKLDSNEQIHCAIYQNTIVKSAQPCQENNSEILNQLQKWNESKRTETNRAEHQ